MGCGPSTLNDRHRDATNNLRLKKRNTRRPALMNEYDLSQRNAEIEAGLVSFHKSSKAIKILLLGPGESGKSTVLKQMKLIHGIGFTDYERIQYTKVLWSDTVQSMKILLEEAPRLGITLECESPGSTLHSYWQLIMSSESNQVYQEDVDEMSISAVQTFLADYVVDYKRGRTQPTKKLGDVNEYDELADYDDFSNASVRGGQEKESLMTGDSSLATKPSVMTKWQMAEAINQIWSNDPGLRECILRANEFQLEVNVVQYFDHVFEYAQKNYKSTDQDILNGRIKTTGITETVFNIKDTNFRMFDVGGQRSERRKWIHCFDNVNVVLFVAAVSEYNQVLYEDTQMNRMKESFQLFESISNSRWFIRTPIILFLNKTDLLEKKLTQVSFKQYFPQFHGNERNYKEVLSFIQQMLLSLNRNPSRQIYVHHTCATDTASMKFVMQATTDMILAKNMALSGII